MDTVNAVCSSVATFAVDAWNYVADGLSALVEKVNSVVFPCLKDTVDISIEAVKSLDSRDWTVLGVGAGLSALVTSVACACLCEAEA
jgi:hypothetical protein